jgi:hypothetical protein
VSEDVCTVLVEDEIMPEPVKFLGGRVKADYNVRMDPWLSVFAREAEAPVATQRNGSELFLLDLDPLWRRSCGG